MKNIVLFCAAGMSTSLLVTKMQNAAKDMNYDVTIAAHPLSDVSKFASEADIILLGPQVRFELKRIQGLYPDKTVEPIEMRAYGMMDGAAVIKRVHEVIGD